MVKQLSHEYVGLVKSQQKAIDLLNDFLWDCIICRPIEAIVQSTQSYAIIDEFLDEIVSPKNIPNSPKALERLEKVFHKSVSDQVMSLIDPDSVKFYEEPAKYYLNFYRLIADVIKTRDDVKSRVEKDLVTLFNKAIKLNKFIDELQPGGLTVFYFIGIAFTVTILSNKNYDAQLVDKIITLWFTLKKASFNYFVD